MSRPARAPAMPGLLPELLRWIALDLCGMVLLVLGGLHLTTGSAPLPAFPQSTLQAVAAVAVGFTLVALAAFKMLAILKSARAGQASGKAQE
ncbi:MAG: hypothetical protein KF909_12005 [Rhodocyclaceae bacterium]|nr:hypothetical protein [Rhodocyclaceae bacterium]MCP5232940.1 hypothetical protein [Zoogloeaceae bacterium]MCB1912323.1 hypothetical protein [Rhodocyclaceae bacterium]MCP5241198.1 hypothetical protein [Zoogloeaceae bacterium]MCP5255002.1 hypothetical protein [Zoogloeaceae bacterium]